MPRTGLTLMKMLTGMTSKPTWKIYRASVTLSFQKSIKNMEDKVVKLDMMMKIMKIYEQ